MNSGLLPIAAFISYPLDSKLVSKALTSFADIGAVPHLHSTSMGAQSVAQQLRERVDAHAFMAIRNPTQ
eukprot:1440189-Amphidinium_carterae.1